jgi:hypothetical protein
MTNWRHGSFLEALGPPGVPWDPAQLELVPLALAPAEMKDRPVLFNVHLACAGLYLVAAK